MRLLIAEDDRSSRTILEHIVGNWGYEPVMAAEGQEAWEALSRPDAPELALLDWEMPGVSGVEICQRLRKRLEGATTYVILLTSKGQREDIVAGLVAGADDYLTKPYDRDELRARLNVGRRILQLQADLAGRLREIEDTLLCIQESFLCGRVPTDLSGIEVVARTIAHGQVAGDFYDFHTHGNDLLDIVVGDVMGKGMRASLLGAALATRFLRCLREHAASSGSVAPPPLAGLLARVRDEVFPQFLETESFATVCYARVDLARRCLELVDCGHPPLLHVSAQTGEATFVGGSNMPLGFSPDEDFVVATLPLAPGDLLVFYSDGVTEATDRSGRMYGEERLACTVKLQAGNSLRDVVGGLLSDIVTHVAGTAIADDVTCVALRVCPPQTTGRGNQR